MPHSVFHVRAPLGRVARLLSSPRLLRDLETFGLEPFEVAQLGNLCPGDAHEAKTLVPSLDMPGRQIDNTRLNELLEQLNSFKQYG